MKRLKQERHARRHAASAEPILDVNTTPLIDVMLVLLVMLIITIPVQLHAVNLNLPVGSPPPAETRPEVVRIDIDARSTVRWNGSAVTGDADLQQRLQDAAAQSPTPEVHVRPDPGASYDRFAAVMVAANRAGLQKLGVVGSEQFIDDK
jgi:biopolymer transport protein ExbD